MRGILWCFQKKFSLRFRAPTKWQNKPRPEEVLLLLLLLLLLSLFRYNCYSD